MRNWSIHPVSALTAITCGRLPNSTYRSHSEWVKVRFLAGICLIILISCTEQSLGATNGRFGDCHTDDGDSPTHLSCATVVSDLPTDNGWEPGRMHFLGIGFYTVLDPL